MKQIKLTQGYVALVNDEDYERVNAFKWHAYIATRKDGTIKTIYAKRNIPKINGKRTTQKMHRFILGITDPKVQADHKDHNGLNNQRYNLRQATHTQNGRNTRISTMNTSGVKGVGWHKGAEKWHARIAVDGNRIHLGNFTDKEEAAHAYDAAALKHHGAFACTNGMLAA
jgi:hypothetical protein